MFEKKHEESVTKAHFHKTQDVMRKGMCGEPERWQRWDGENYAVCITYVGEKYVYLQVQRRADTSRYLPEIYVDKDFDAQKFTDVRIQTTSYGSLEIPEIQKLTEAMAAAVETCGYITKQFLEPLNAGTFDRNV